jgi:hypothetical protein
MKRRFECCFTRVVVRKVVESVTFQIEARSRPDARRKAQGIRDDMESDLEWQAVSIGDEDVEYVEEDYGIEVEELTGNSIEVIPLGQIGFRLGPPISKAKFIDTSKREGTP